MPTPSSGPPSLPRLAAARRRACARAERAARDRRRPRAADSGRPRRRRAPRPPSRPGTAAPRARRGPGSGGTASCWRHVGLVGAVDRRLDDHRRRAVARARRPAVDQPAHVLGEAGHVERAVLHADIDVVGPGARVLAALRVGQHMAGVLARVVDRLVLLQQLDRAIDAFRHEFPTIDLCRPSDASSKVASP